MSQSNDISNVNKHNFRNLTFKVRMMYNNNNEGNAHFSKYMNYSYTCMFLKNVAYKDL